MTSTSSMAAGRVEGRLMCRQTRPDLPRFPRFGGAGRARHNGGVTRSTRALAMGCATALALAALPALAMAHGDEPPEPRLPGVLLAWSLDPLPLIGVALAAAGYLWATRRLARSGTRKPHPRWRTLSFLAGLAAIVVALSSPIEAYEGVLFSVHMVQHMLLELVAAPLLLLGAPVTLALRIASPSVRGRMLAILHGRVVALISFPLVGWLVFAGVNWGWHFSTLYDQALENAALHYVQHASFLAASLLFWWPVIGADPSRWRLPYPVRLFYLFLAMPQNSFLGVALMSAGTILYPHYLSNLRTWGPTALADQSAGGILMWVGGDLVFLTAMGAVVAAWVRHEDRRTARLDARLDADRHASESRSPS
jgi:putative copper resistance protein D